MVLVSAETLPLERSEQVVIVRVDHHRDRAYRGMAEEGVERARNDRPAADAAILLWPLGRLAGALSHPGGLPRQRRRPPVTRSPGSVVMRTHR